MVAEQLIRHIEYVGLIVLQSEGSGDGRLHQFRLNTPENFNSDNFWLSHNQLVKFKSKQYLLQVDGIIYEFDHQVFSEDQYPNLVDNLLADPESALRRINGEFTLILVNMETSAVLIANGESGNAALYYQESAENIVFSNSINGLLQLFDRRPDLNHQRVFDVLSAQNLGSAETCFRDILRLQPGHCLTIRDGKSKLSEYSQLLPFKGRRSEIADPYVKFRDIFSEAVKRRMKAQKTGLALSSGKDSTTVAAMMAAMKSTDQFVNGYTYEPTYLPDELQNDLRFNESLLLEGFYEKYPELDRKKVKVEAGFFLDSLEKTIEIFGEPLYGASNQFWIQHMHQLIKLDGCEAMWTGQGGNFTISWPPPELVKGNRKTLRKMIKGIIGSGQPKEYPYLNREFIDIVDTSSSLVKQSKSDIPEMQPNFLRNSLAYTGQLQKQASLYHGFHISDPTVDKYLLEFCLSAPYDVYHDRHLSRKLVTVGMKDFLPSEIVDNQIRGLQASDLQYRLNEEREKVLEKLLFLNKNKLVTFVLNMDKLIEDWPRFDFLHMSRKNLNHLSRLILTGIFLSKWGE